MAANPVVFNLVVIRSRDLNLARAFYEALGVEFAQHSHGHGPVHLANEADGQVFEIYPLTEKDQPIDMHPGFVGLGDSPAIRIHFFQQSLVAQSAHQ